MAAVPLVEVISMAHSSQSRTKIEQARKMRCFQQVTVATTSLSSLALRPEWPMSPSTAAANPQPRAPPLTSSYARCQIPKRANTHLGPPLTGRFPAKHTHTPAHSHTTAASIVNSENFVHCGQQGTRKQRQCRPHDRHDVSRARKHAILLPRRPLTQLEPKWIMEAAFEAEPSFPTQIHDPQEKGGDSEGDVSDRKTPAKLREPLSHVRWNLGCSRNLTTSNRRLLPTPPRVVRYRALRIRTGE